jgi:hypothetical protein
MKFAVKKAKKMPKEARAVSKIMFLLALLMFFFYFLA